MLRCLVVLTLLVLAACAQSPDRRLKAQTAALTAATGAAPITHAKVVARMVAYQALVERQRALNAQAKCELDPEPSYECMSTQEREEYVAKYPDELHEVQVLGSSIKRADIITNNQEPGVDEGALVKKSGDYLFLLENATLHSIRIVRDGREVLEHVNTVPLNSEPLATEDVWYDEILVLDDQLLVLGFNYLEQVAELHSYHIDRDGKLQRNAKYWLRSGDYFSSSGYASRIHLGKLVTRMTVQIDTEAPDFDWPEWSRRDVEKPIWNLMVDTPNLSYALGAFDELMGIHVLLQCELDALALGRFDCRNQGVVGPLAATFYVAPNAAYLAFAHLSPDAFGNPQFNARFDAPTWATNPPLAARTTIARLDLVGNQPPVFAQVLGSVNDALNFSERGKVLYVVSTHFEQKLRKSIPMLNQIFSTDWSVTRAHLITPIETIHDFKTLSQTRFTATAVWLSDVDYSGEYSAETLYRLPLAGGIPRHYVIGHQAALLQPLPDRMLVIGDAKEGMAASVFVDAQDASVSAMFDEAKWPMRSLAESRSQAVSVRVQADGRILAGWPACKKLEDGQWLDQASDLHFVELNGVQIRDAGTLDMQDVTAASEAQAAFYGDARIAFIGPRIFVFSRNLVKEAVYQNATMSLVRRLDLALATRQ